MAATTASLRAIEELRSKLIGTSLGEGKTSIRGYEAWMADHAVQAPHDQEIVHPLWPLIAGLRAHDDLIATLCELIEMREQDTVVFGELELRQSSFLELDEVYRVIGTIVDVSRHSGKRSGTFDKLEFELSLVDAAQVTRAVTRCSFIFLRGIE